jgi:5-methylcytosine-specific restriction endonuclease McrA
MNVVTACRPCNHRKSSRTPEQAHMPLLYTPYVPSLWEDFILRNRRILADQMEFLMAHVPSSSRLLV